MRLWASRLVVPALLILALTSGGCGGSSSGSGKVVVAIAPQAVLVALNGSQQFVASVTGGKGIAIAATNGAVRGANVVTITTTVAHGFSAGQTVTIAGVTDVSFNGSFQILSVPSPTTFTFTQTGTDATSGNGSVTNVAVNWFVNDKQGGDPSVGTITSTGLYTAPSALPPPTAATITATGAVRASNTVTITTSAAHNFVVGQVVIISGVTDTSFNGTFAILTVPSTTTFTYSQTASNASSGNGTATSFAVRIKAVSAADSTASATGTVSIDSGITITLNVTNATVGTGESFQFTATLTGAPNNNQNVNWFVNNVAGGDNTVGTISASGLYTAPATPPSPSTVTVKAVSVSDSTRSASASVGILTAQAPTLTAVNPTTVPQGAFLQYVYLTGTNFLSTSLARANGIALPTFLVTQNLIRATLGPTQLDSAGTLSVDVQPFSGAATSAINVNVVAVRPAMVGPSPDSVAQGSGAVTVNFNGGYYSPSVTSEFNGGVRANSILNSRQLSVVLSAADLTTAGLFPIAARNASATPPLAATNLAIQPTAAPSVIATVPVGTQPAAVAVNPSTGIAVIANRGSNNITLLDFSSNTVTGTIAVGTTPTGVAVDALRNLAYVANNGNNTVSVVDLAGGTVTATISGFPAPPVSVTMNPTTRLGVVAMASTNAAAVVDLNANKIISSAAVGTGANPQAAMVPQLNWAVVTPGGGGTMAIIDPSRLTTASIAASNGATRANNAVTITTTAAHSLNVGQTVFIDGVTDSSFDGIFTVASVPSTTTFTYAQTASAATSGGGTATFTPPVATVNLGNSVRGVGLNLETMQAYLTDPTSSKGIVFSLLDQTVTNVSLEIGAVAAAASPFTNFGLSVNSTTNELSVVDLRVPVRLSRISVGTGPQAVAVDPGNNVAVVANGGSNDVTLVALGAIRSLHVLDVTPAITFSGANPVNITIIGNGFTSTSAVRLDETPLTTTFVNSRTLTATVPANMLASARRFALDVEDSGTLSNVEGFTVIQAIAVGTTPRAVAIDPDRNIALVTNSGSNDVSVVDLAAGSVTSTISVGTNPQGVAILSRESLAVVTNRGSNNASVIDLAAGTVKQTVNVGGTEPVGVAINQDTGVAVVANAVSSTVSIFPADSSTAPNPTVVSVNQQPIAVAIDPTRNQALILHAAANNVGILQLDATSPVLQNVINNIPLPSGAFYDPGTDRYVVASSLSNNLIIVNPTNTFPTSLRAGINPTSIAYNVNSATLITLNTASKTMTVLDFIDRRVRAILPLTGSPLLAMEIHPRTNIAVVADDANNRVLLVPLPR